MIRGRIPKLRVLCRVYEPQPDQYTIKEESEKIHSLMQSMYEELLKTETKNAESLTHPCANASHIHTNKIKLQLNSQNTTRAPDNSLAPLLS